MDYGIIFTENESDAIAIYVPDIDMNDPLARDKLEILSSANLPKLVQFIFNGDLTNGIHSFQPSSLKDQFVA